MGSIPTPKRVLLVTNSEHGQANVFLATSYALLTLEDEDVEVHFASFPPIQSFVTTTSEHAQRDKAGVRPIVFHTIDGVDMVSAWTRPEILAQQAALSVRSRIPLMDAVRRTLVLLKVTMPWTGPEFVQIMHSVTGIVQVVQPDIIAVDPAFAPALTALRHIGTRFIVLSPNTIKDFALPIQPNAEALWKYPCIGTAHPFPTPLAAIPRNILLILIILLVSIFDPNRRTLAAYLAEHYVPVTPIPAPDPSSDSPPDPTSNPAPDPPSASPSNPSPEPVLDETHSPTPNPHQQHHQNEIVTPAPPKLTTLTDLSLNAPALRARFLVANLPELEFPLQLIPPHVVPCGPMLRPARPVEEADPDLAAWLADAAREDGSEGGGGVVYINLGTHVFFDEGSAGEMARAVRRLLDAANVSDGDYDGGEVQAGEVEEGMEEVEVEEKRKRGRRGLRVLWKIPRANVGGGEKEGSKDKGGLVFGKNSVVYELLGKEIERGVVRVVEWIQAEPTAVLESGAIICAVHHGGANSFLESASAGVPQVVLPLWMDTYDFARRVEFLGIGRWGNQVADKLCEGEELGSILVDVVVGERSSAYAQKAKELAELCKKSGGGRVIAARHILAEIEGHNPEVLPSEGEKETDPLLNGDATAGNATGDASGQ